MTERDSDYRWTAVGPDVAVGYKRDPLGGWAMFGLVVYSPDTVKLRGIKLRDEAMTDNASLTDAIEQREPPTLEQVAEAWLSHSGAFAAGSLSLSGTVTGSARLVGNATLNATAVVSGADPERAGWAEVEAATQRSELTRREGEAPADFYRRVARAYAALNRVGTVRPKTAELATRAGVPVGTAASWISRARARGLLDETEEELR